MIFNVCLISLIIVGCIAAYFYLIKSNPEEELEVSPDQYTMEHLKQIVDQKMRLKLNADIIDYGKSEEDIIKQRKLKLESKRAYKECQLGSVKAKELVKSDYRSIIESCSELPINEHTINYLIPFNDFSRLTVMDKFDIILYWYKKFKKYNAMSELIDNFVLDAPKLAKDDDDEDFGSEYYEIDSEDINRVFDDVVFNPDFNVESNYDRQAGVPPLDLTMLDKINILTQRVYQELRGHGCVDELRDMRVDGINVGTSGIPYGLFDFDEESLKNCVYSYDAVWLLYSGNMIHLSFMGFRSQAELERVCKTIYKYDAPAQLSESKGHIESSMMDGSRLVTVRPPFSESWGFFLRKFGTSAGRTIESIIRGVNSHIAIDACAVCYKANRNIAVTGEQGCGKTTLLRTLIQFYRKRYTLRPQESMFELCLRVLYPNRNIASFRETGEITSQEGINTQKKTDGQINIMGEVADAATAACLLQITKVGSLATTFTHHAKTVPDLITAFRDNLLQTKTFTNEKVAEENVAESLNIDIHCAKDQQGNRFIDLISEIIPLGFSDLPEDPVEATKEYQRRRTLKHCFSVNDIVKFIPFEKPNEEGLAGEFVLVNKFSVEIQKKMAPLLTKKEKAKYQYLFLKPWAEVEVLHVTER